MLRNAVRNRPLLLYHLTESASSTFGPVCPRCRTSSAISAMMSTKAKARRKEVRQEARKGDKTNEAPLTVEQKKKAALKKEVAASEAKKNRKALEAAMKTGGQTFTKAKLNGMAKQMSVRKVKSKRSDPVTKIWEKKPLTKEADKVLSAEEELKQRGTVVRETKKGVNPDAHDVQPLEIEGQQQVRGLQHGLDRVLFNPGVFWLQDPRSRIYNFNPYLQKIMPVTEFDFDAVSSYITSSKDTTLTGLAKKHRKKYIGSTSSMTSALSHFHFLISAWRPLNFDVVSRSFASKLTSFTAISRLPTSIFLRYKGDGVYAIDADKEFDSESILSLLGQSMEKLLTLPKDKYDQYRLENSHQLAHHDRNRPETYHYSTFGDFLMRSQLDAYDPRLPGSGMFDLKTRAVVSVRMDSQNAHLGAGYQIKTRHGTWESFEREYFDMIRSAFLKYSLQARMGRMDGIYVTYHNTEKIFGFQYVPLDEMDSTIHGGPNIGQKEFKLSLQLLNKLFDRATKRFPEKSLRVFFETRPTQEPLMYVFSEPMEEDQIEEIQQGERRDVQEFLKALGEKIKAAEENPPVVEKTPKQKKKQVKREEPSAKASTPVKAVELAESPKIKETSAETSTPVEAAEEKQQVERKEPSAEAPIPVEVVEQAESPDTMETSAEVSSLAEGVKDAPAAALPGTGKALPENETIKDTGNKEASEDTKDIFRTKPAVGFEMDPNSPELQEDSAFLDSLEKEAEALESEDILGFTLTTKNYVNGRIVTRPHNLSSDDKWEVEYSISEMKTASRAWATYNSLKLRREKSSFRSGDDPETDIDPYLKQLQDMSVKGRKWELEWAEKDKGRPQIMFESYVDQEARKKTMEENSGEKLEGK